MAGDSFLKHLIQFTNGVLCSAAATADAFTQTCCGHQNKREERDAEQRQFPVGCEDDEGQADHGKYLPEDIGKHV